MSATAILDLASRACRYAAAIRERQEAERALDAAYMAWKQYHGITYVTRGSDDWQRMLEAVTEEHQAVRRAKSRERYHRDYLVRLAEGVAL